VSCAVRSHYNLFRRVSNRAMSAVYSVTNFHMSLETLENGDVTKGSLSKAFFSLCVGERSRYECCKFGEIGFSGYAMQCVAVVFG